MRDARRVSGVSSNLDPKLAQITAASSLDEKYKVNHIQTGVDPFDAVLDGGVVLSQSILFAGSPGSRKTSMGLCALDGLTKKTERRMLVVSAEQNTAGVMNLCQINNVSNDRILIHANDLYENDLHHILKRCDEIRPFACLFDSLQPISQISGMNEEVVAQKLAEYCQKTKMIGIIISQLTKGGEFKGGTGASYYTDTLVLFEPYRPSIDGDPSTRFGTKVAHDVIGYTQEMRARDIIENLRVLVGGAFGKNRYGAIDQKAYIFTAASGEMQHLKVKPAGGESHE